MGGATNANMKHVIKRDLVRYMDQHRWQHEYLHSTFILWGRTKSPARKRVELARALEFMGTLRLTYQRIESLQAALGLSTAEGASYG